MRIITLHCDYIKFKPLKKAIKNPEELSKSDQEEKNIKDPLVVLTAVEKGDNDKTVGELVSAVKKTAGEVKAKNIVLYPYAHLSSNLSDPTTALEYMVEAESTLRSLGFEVVRAPFGYYKEFELKVKGHPLSELSKEFNSQKGEDVKVAHKVINIKDEKEVDPSKILHEISRSKLDTSKLKENDHRILGQKLNLFSFNEVAPGMVFWHKNGLIIYNELVEYWREEHKKAGYEEIKTPQVMDSKLWKVSGHWDKYKENNFVTQYEERPFLVKPMNCPGGMLVFKSGTKSYRDLPLRVGEMGVVHRTELSGVLNGLFRVIQFTQDDAHIFCADNEQAEKEITGVTELIQKFYDKFGIEFDHVELSTRPEKRIGSDEMWDTAEKLLEDTLKKLKIKYKVNKGDGAFYGPKIDFHIKDSLGRTWQLSTIQLDFSMPERFELEYVGKDNKNHRPIMLHRVIYGSLERFIGILLEHTNGKLPLWLSPVQVRIIDFTERNTKSAGKIMEEIKDSIPLLRIDGDFRSTTINEKIRDAEMQKIPYIVVIGDKEEQAKTLAVRERGSSKPKFGVKLPDFIKELKEKIEKRN